MFSTLKRLVPWGFGALLIATVASPSFADIAVGGGAGAVNVKNTVLVAPATSFPVTLSTTIPVNCIGGCGGSTAIGKYSASPAPTLAPGATSPLSLDQSGGLVISTTSISTAYDSQYNLFPVTYQDGQSALQAVDLNGRTIVTVATPMPISLQQYASTIIDHSGTVAAGGSAQVIMVQSSTRHGIIFQNTSAAVEWISLFNGLAVQSQPSIAIYPSSAPFVTPNNLAPQGQISVIGATTGQAFTAEEY